MDHGISGSPSPELRHPPNLPPSPPKSPSLSPPSSYPDSFLFDFSNGIWLRFNLFPLARLGLLFFLFVPTVLLYFLCGQYDLPAKIKPVEPGLSSGPLRSFYQDWAFSARPMVFLQTRQAVSRSIHQLFLYPLFFLDFFFLDPFPFS